MPELFTIKFSCTNVCCTHNANIAIYSSLVTSKALGYTHSLWAFNKSAAAFALLKSFAVITTL